MTTNRKDKIANPYPKAAVQRCIVADDGSVGYTWDDPEHPGYQAFEGLTEKSKRDHLTRKGLGLATTPKYPALSDVIRDKRHHVNDQMRVSRFLDGKDGGSISAELAFERMQDATLKDEVRQGWWDRHRRAMRIPDARAVDENGGTAEGDIGKTLFDILQAARTRIRVSSIFCAVSAEGEARELPAPERENGTSP